RQFRRKGDHDYRVFREKMLALIENVAHSLELKFDRGMLDFLIEKNRDDIRGIVNDSISLMSSRTGRETESVGERDSPTGIFDIMVETFKGKSYDDLLFHLINKDFETEDYMMWIDENLSMEAENPEDLASAYDLVSRSDLLLGAVTRKQHYAFKGYAEEMLAGISLKIEKKNEHFVKYQFPGYIMKMSRMRENRDQRKTLVWKLGRITHSPKESVLENLWYFKLLFKSGSQKKLIERLDLTQKEMDILRRS
ncbi:MAG: hypothetical protein QXV22_00005, partial [Thermoplasmataceae archaeon]